MFPPRSRLPLLVAACWLLLGSWPALAQKPEWKPIAELFVGSIGEQDPVRMADVMTRCTALSMTLSGLAIDFSPEMAKLYKDQATRFIQYSVLIESQLEQEITGLEADITVLSVTILEKLKGMISGYSQWMDHNNANDGSFFNKDIEMEMSSCQLATKLASQMSANG